MSNRIAGLSGFDVDGTVQKLMKAERMKVDKVIKEKKMNEYKNEVWEETNAEIFDFWQENVKKMKRPSTYLANTASIMNGDLANVTSTADATNGTYSVKVSQLAKSSFLNSDELADENIDNPGTLTLDYSGNTVNIDITSADGPYGIMNKINDEMETLGVKATYDSNLKRFFLSADSQGADGEQISISGDEALLNELGFDDTRRTGTTSQRSIIEFNGEELTFDSNDIRVAGINFELKETSPTETTITVNSNVDEVYENIKDFITGYNDILKGLDEKINADSARGYEPLSEDDKKAMTDEEIELWQDKIKGSILRRDSRLKGLSDSLRNKMTSSLGVDTSGFDYNYLFEIGIETGDYKEKGELHIVGDKDDTYSAGKENKLKTLIEEEPRKIQEFMMRMAETVDEDIQNRMSSTSLSSAFSIYNNKQILEKQRDLEEEVISLEEDMTRIEDNYYKEFSAMEAALNKLNAQGQWLQSQLGGM